MVVQVIWNGYEKGPYTRPFPIGTEPHRDESGGGEFEGRTELSVLSIVGSESPLAPEPLVQSVSSVDQKICRVETWFAMLIYLVQIMPQFLKYLIASRHLAILIHPVANHSCYFQFNVRISLFCFTLYYSLTTCVADGEGGPGPRSLSQPKPQFKMRGMGKLRFSLICTQALPPVG